MNTTRVIRMQMRKIQPPDFDFEGLVREVKQATIPWTRHYKEYQSGGWWTCALLGRSADATDAEVTDAVRPAVTGLLEKLPVTRKLLEDLQLSYMIVRLARLDPESELWEHKDYQDLRQVSRQRIHLPIETNPDAFLVSGGRRFHMGLGSLWSFRPTTAHGACNAGAGPRLHLILDVYEDGRLKKLIERAAPSSPTAMAEMPPEALAEKVRGLYADLRRGPEAEGLARWERAVLKLYFEVAVPEGQLYRSLEQACRENGDRERADFWAAQRLLMLGTGLDD